VKVSAPILITAVLRIHTQVYKDSDPGSTSGTGSLASAAYVFASNPVAALGSSGAAIGAKYGIDLSSISVRPAVFVFGRKTWGVM
jgi:hypothetical protein